MPFTYVHGQDFKTIWRSLLSKQRQRFDFGKTIKRLIQILYNTLIQIFVKFNLRISGNAELISGEVYYKFRIILGGFTQESLSIERLNYELGETLTKQARSCYC